MMKWKVLSVVVASLVVITVGEAQDQPPSPASVSSNPQGLLFDFQDADLRFVLGSLAEAAGLNLVYSDLPSRRVTLRTNQPVPVDQILPLLRSLAASNGLRVVEEGGFVRLEDTGTRDRAASAAPRDTTPPRDLRLFVYRLKHARANRLAGTLQAIFGGTTTAAGRQTNPGASRMAPTLSQELRGQQILPLPAEPPVAVEMGNTQAPGIPGRLRGDVQIVPDEATNSLLVRAQAEDWEIVRQSVQALDLRPLQVLIEVLIAEVRRGSDLDVGVSAKVGADSGAIGNSATLKGSTAGDFALRIMRVGKVDIDVAMSILSSSGSVRIISRPVLLAQNNQEARILIGSERPFVQVSRSLPTDEAVRDQVVQYRDVGTQLNITPTINEDGYVNLQLSQQVSTATTEIQFGAPVISTREASTHLFVQNGQTVVIGGLVDREVNSSRSGVPILKDLPLLGFLFGTTQRSEVRSELFLFVTPHIIATDDDARTIGDGLEKGTDLLRRVLPVAPLIPPSTSRDSVR